jgi:hypothetical protein
MWRGATSQQAINGQLSALSALGGAQSKTCCERSVGQPILAAGRLSGGPADWKAGLQARLPAPRMFQAPPGPSATRPQDAILPHFCEAK